jgi:hypothetical protein
MGNACVNGSGFSVSSSSHSGQPDSLLIGWKPESVYPSFYRPDGSFFFPLLYSGQTNKARLTTKQRCLLAWLSAANPSGCEDARPTLHVSNTLIRPLTFAGNLRPGITVSASEVSNVWVNSPACNSLNIRRTLF